MKRFSVMTFAISLALLGAWASGKAEMETMHDDQHSSHGDSSMSHERMQGAEMSHGDHAAMNTDEAGALLLDPVCGMWISRESASTVVENAGQEFAFCMPGHRQQFDADSSEFWGHHQTQSTEIDGYRVNLDLMSMGAYHRMLAGQPQHMGSMNMNADDSHHLRLQIMDEAGDVVDDAVVTVKSTRRDATRGALVRAKNSGRFYGASLQLGSPGEYAIEVGFTGGDSRRRVVTMSYAGR